MHTARTVHAARSYIDRSSLVSRALSCIVSSAFKAPLRCVMVYMCAVPGCKSGLKGEIKPSVFKFPSDEALRRKWIKNINRVNADGSSWIPTEYHRVCARHFYDCDLETTSQDNCISRRAGRQKCSLTRFRLKQQAVPKIIEELKLNWNPQSVQQRPYQLFLTN